MDLWLIGIGTGNPDHVTLEARAALRAAHTILVPRKGAGKEDLAELRDKILHQAGAQGRVVAFDYPTRDPDLPYIARVRAWHDEIAARWQAALAGHGAQDGPVALLVWGDPSLYDSTLRIAARLHPAPNVRVVPGITALSALTAAHAIPFNGLAGAVTVTTGRRLRNHGWPEGAESVAVMLDGAGAFRDLTNKGVRIWWGAYLGMEEEILIAGDLDADLAARIWDKRTAARTAHGWIMECYLLRAKGVE